ncbi:MAG: threonine synthase [Phylliscum demangeonii]|nr:MAG: threonine synthase [Phylliscum demangeonii]
MPSPTSSQRYLSTRGESYDLSFEEVILKGLAPDGGLFIPEDIPALPPDWATGWRDLSFADLAFHICSLYIAPDEIPPADLRAIIQRSYATFRHPSITPLVTLDADQHLHLLELFHGPTFAFKDVALQFLGNLFEYVLQRKNRAAVGPDRHHLTVVGATSGDTGSAAIYGLRGKEDVSVFILHPKGKISPVQEAQMTTVLDKNVHNLAVHGTFDDCQDMVKALFADPILNSTHHLAAVNSINWARILAQTTYFFYAFFAVSRLPTFHPATSRVRFVVPTGNFGDVLAGYFAKRMGLPIEKLVVATNENDILDRFWRSGHYEKKARHGRLAQGGLAADGAKAHAAGVQETLTPAMDILVSSNFERLLWYLAFEDAPAAEVRAKREAAGRRVQGWLEALKRDGGFSVPPAILRLAQRDFESDKVSDAETLAIIQQTFTGAPWTPASAPRPRGYVLDPHSAIGVAASLRSLGRHLSPPATHHISLATAHPAKFAHAVDLALHAEPGYSFEAILPAPLVGLETRPKRIRVVDAGVRWEDLRGLIVDELEREGRGVRP